MTLLSESEDMRGLTEAENLLSLIRAGSDASVIAALDELLPRWIPVGERLPEASTEVLVAWSLPGGGQQVDAALIFDNGMWAATVGHSIGRVTHWMPLPEPPEVK